MLYKKDPNMTYSDMAIFSDNNNMNLDPAVQEKIFEYFYHLFYINAVKGRLFRTSEDYDNYSLYCANRLFLYYQRRREKGKEPIKSCVNYIKSVFRVYKVDYNRLYYNQIFQMEVSDDDMEKNYKSDKELFKVEQLKKQKEEHYRQINETLRENKAREIKRVNSDILHAEYELYLREIPATMMGCLKTSPYIKDRAKMHNIYLSCLFTFLKLTTLSNANKDRLTNRDLTSKSTVDLIDQLYEEESNDSVVLWHLDSSMSGYIAIMVNIIKKEIVKDLRYIIGSNELPDSVIKDMLATTDAVAVHNYDRDDI